MEKNTEKFLQLFNRMETALKEALKRDYYMSFTKMVFEASRHDKFIKKNKDMLESIGSLRNVLVHEEGKVVMAIPSEETIDILEEIVERYTKPRKVHECCHEPVQLIKSGQTLKDALDLMESTGYSKLPIYENGKCIGLLTGNMISRWLRKNRENEMQLKTLLEVTRIRDVMTYQKLKDHIKFIPKDMNVNEFITQAAKEPSPSGVYIMTEHGLDTEKPITLITSYDYPKIYG